MRLPIIEAADQAGDTGVDVHDGAAGEIERALLEQEAGVGVDRVERRLPLSAAAAMASGPSQYQTMCAIGK